jgi:CBS-domain-containing membrane protein
MAMMALRIVHPPAGSNPVIAVLGAAHWDFIVLPTLLGAVVIVLCALVYHNARRGTQYPQRW